MARRELNTFYVHTIRANRSFQILQKWEEYHTRTKNGRTEEVRDRWWYKFRGCENLHIAFHRWFPISNSEFERKEDKKKFLDAIVQLAGSLTPSELQACNERVKNQLVAYEKQGWKNDSLGTDGLPTQWRLVVGLGSESVLETSMTLHHLYGFPYLPAPAVKGLARAYALYAEGKACDNDDFRLNPSAQTDATATNIFGSQDRVGQVIFFDAFPTEFPKLDVDVINVHYQEYYSSNGTVPPGDWMSPIPAFFLTVAPNTKFNFYLASRDQNLLKLARKWLVAGLTQLGIGGKTSAGYGYFALSDAARPVAATSSEDDAIAMGQRSPPPGAVLANVIDTSTKPMRVEIVGSKEVVQCPAVHTKGLGIESGSQIYVTLVRDKKTKKIISAKYAGKP